MKNINDLLKSANVGSGLTIIQSIELLVSQRNHWLSEFNHSERHVIKLVEENERLRILVNEPHVQLELELWADKISAQQRIKELEYHVGQLEEYFKPEISASVELPIVKEQVRKLEIQLMNVIKGMPEWWRTE